MRYHESYIRTVRNFIDRLKQDPALQVFDLPLGDGLTLVRRVTAPGAVSFIAGDAFHLWHGAPENRRLRQRHEGLRPYAFNPCEDIAIADNGCWRWATDKPQLHAYVRDYFAARKEDG